MRLKSVIYALTDPRDGLIYYVGQSRRGLVRAKRHRQPATLRHDGDTPKTRWIRALIAAGFEYGIQELASVSHATYAHVVEREWIDKLRLAGHPLTNTISPTTHPFSELHRARLSAAAKERGSDPAYRKKMANMNRGRVVSDETRARQSLSQKIRGRSLVEKQRRSALATAIFTGVPRTDSARLAIARAHGARPFTNQFGQRFESVRQAARALEVDSSSISKVLRGKQSHAKGHVFTYL